MVAKTPEIRRNRPIQAGRVFSLSEAFLDRAEFTNPDTTAIPGRLEVYNERLMTFSTIHPFRSWPADAVRCARRRFHAMVKPIGSACNLDCKYCYYLSKEDLLDQHHGGRIAEDLLEEFIRQYIEGQDGDGWSSPGRAASRRCWGWISSARSSSWRQKHKRPGQRIENDLQTNGTLLDEEWCRFLREHGFLVGLSIDGPRRPARRLPRDQGRRAYFRQGLRGREAAEEARREVQHADRGQPPQREAAAGRVPFPTREVGSTYVQLIPCVEPKDFRTTAPQRWDAANAPADRHARPPGPARRTPSSPTGRSTRTTWARSSARSSTSGIARTWGGCWSICSSRPWRSGWACPRSAASTGEFCGKGVALEHDGSVYSCDHYVYPEYRLGNIHEHPIAEMVFSRRQMEFGFAKRDTLPAYCRECKYLFACWGECPKNRLHQDAGGRRRAELPMRRAEAVLRARGSAPKTNCPTVATKVSRQ